MLWQWILIIQTLVSQENPEDFSKHYFCRTISSPRVYESNSHYCSCCWNNHTNIVGRHINLFSDCMCLFFSFNFPTPNSRTIRWNTTTQWIPLKLDATGEMLRPEVIGICLGTEACHITESILKRHFMPETFISIDNNLQRKVMLHNIDRLSRDTAFWNLHFYMPNVMSEEILGFFMWYQCLYYPYSPIYSQNWNKNIYSH